MTTKDKVDALIDLSMDNFSSWEVDFLSDIIDNYLRLGSISSTKVEENKINELYNKYIEGAE